jgi:NitT/TauT family transport system substrate-binding protein
MSVRAQERIKLGLLPFSESLPAVIADRQGYFKEEGLQVEISTFESGALAVPVLQSGRLDITLSSTVSTLQGVEVGLDAVVLAPAAVVRAMPPDSTTAVVVRKNSVKSLKDLEGKRVAVNVIKSSSWLHLVALLDKYGVDWTKIRLSEVPPPQMSDPLLAGQLDAILQNDPFRTVLMETGKIEYMGWPYVETAPNTDITQFIALAPWVAKNQATAAKFVRAVAKGSQFVESNDAVAREINQQFTNLNSALKDKVMLPRFGTEINLKDLNHTMEMMQKYGLLKGPVNLSDRVFRAQ